MRSSEAHPPDAIWRLTRFSLRSLLFLILLFAFLLALANHWVLRPYRAGQEALARAKALRGTIYRGHRGAQWLDKVLGSQAYQEVTALHLQRMRVNDADLAHMKDFPHLGGLILQGTQVTDACLVSIRPLKELVQLDLSETRVTQVVLDDFPKLEELDLAKDRVTRLELRRMPKLKSLRLVGAQIAEAGLDGLKGADALESLSLMFTDVRDEHLNALKGFKSLRRLRLEGTQVSEAAVAELQRSLPSLEISR